MANKINKFSTSSLICGRLVRAREGHVLGILVAFTLLAGCPVTQSLPKQATVQEFSQSDGEGKYLLYVPSVYTKERTWPLVILCHGTWPYDSAEAQMREWANFAEYEGIIVAAPTLASSRGDFPPPPAKQIELQAEDERTLLATVSEIKRRFSIDEPRVFMTGWSAGAYPLLYTGLRHPDIFRALYIRQGAFDERFMPLAGTKISRWQQIKIVYGKSDILRDQTVACIKWLQENKAWAEEEEVAGIHRRIDPKYTWDFFEKVVRERPWIRISPERVAGDDALAMRFRLDSVPRAVKQKWFFGDGAESYEHSPTHTYDRPGPYTVRVNVALEGGKVFTRTEEINVIRVLGAPE
ncbi:MAG TPA: PKD domain-containing protein [Phycisphaerae bacterium]|nr:PKD domain-containing protein [Phycisphaerae bacterium]